MPREAQPKAVVQVTEAFERAGIEQPEDTEERDRLFKLIGATNAIANEQVLAMVTEWRDHARKRDDETARLRETVAKYAAHAKAYEANVKAQAEKAIANLQSQLADAQSQLAIKHAGDAEQASQSSALSIEDLSLLVGQSTSQPDG